VALAVLDLRGAMAHPDYVVSNVVALTLVAAMAAAFVLLGYIGQELADQLPPALSGTP
jgi:hypothetical protein